MSRSSFVARVALAGVLFSPPLLADDKPARSELWKQHCEKCHGADGRADTEEGKKKGARDLTNSKWQKTISDDRFARSIVRGRDKMPSFAKILSDDEVKALVRDVRALAAQ